MVNRRPPSRRETNGKGVVTATAEVRGAELFSSQKRMGDSGFPTFPLVAIWGPNWGAADRGSAPGVVLSPFDCPSFPCGDNAV